MIARKIEMRDLVETGSIGPFAVGRILSEIGNEIGPPDYWSFSPGKELNFYIVYGALEVYLRVNDNIGVVEFLKLKAFKFKNRSTILRNIYNGNVLHIAIKDTWRTYESAKSALHRIGVEFSTDFQEPVKPDTSAVINIGRSIRLYFRESEGSNILESVELS